MVLLVDYFLHCFVILVDFDNLMNCCLVVVAFVDNYCNVVAASLVELLAIFVVVAAAANYIVADTFDSYSVVAVEQMLGFAPKLVLVQPNRFHLNHCLLLPMTDTFLMNCSQLN